MVLAALQGTRMELYTLLWKAVHQSAGLLPQHCAVVPPRNMGSQGCRESLLLLGTHGLGECLPTV